MNFFFLSYFLWTCVWLLLDGAFTVTGMRSPKRMAENSRMSKLSSKDDECVFSWKLFTGWDYMIGELLHFPISHAAFATLAPPSALCYTYGKVKHTRYRELTYVHICVPKL